jgi:hypothetical protein
MTIQPTTDLFPVFEPELGMSQDPYWRLSVAERVAHTAYTTMLLLEDISPGTEYYVGGSVQYKLAQRAIDILNMHDTTPVDLRKFGKACFYTVPSSDDQAMRYIVYKTPDAHDNVYSLVTEQ